MKTPIAYHPDPEINALVAEEAAEGERTNLAAGLSPSRWQCECGASHTRGFLDGVSLHRCLGCGYIGTGGVLLD